MADQAAPSMSNRAVLRLPEFRKLFAAQAISDLGDGLTFTALLLLVNDLTHSPVSLAILSIAVAVPSMVAGIVAGAIADRFDRRRIMIASDSIRTVLVLGFVAVATVERLPILYLVAFAQATIGTFFSPARSSLIPRVVPREGLMAANGLGQVSRMIGGLIGTGVAGVLVAVTGQFWPAFVLDAATFAASVLIVSRVDRSIGLPGADAEGRAPQGIRASVFEGLRLIGGSPTLLATLVGLAIAMLGMGAVNLLFVPFVINELHESAIWMGPLEAAQTTSMVLAAGSLGFLASRVSSQAVMVGGLVGIGSLIAILSVTPNVPVLLVVVFAVGWFVTPAQAATQTIIQTQTADHVRGRVFGAFGSVFSTTTIVSTAVAGAVAGLIGVRAVFLAGGLICLAAALVSALLFRADRNARPVGSKDEATIPPGETPPAEPAIATG